MRKVISLFLAVAFTVLTIASPIVTEAVEPEKDIKSTSAYMINLDSSKVIYQKNIDTQMDPASLTKMMTCILALENVDDLENTMVEATTDVFDEIYGMNASNADIRPGEVVSMKDLLYALMLQSACEAAGIIANYISNGNPSDFVKMMNDKAKEIGCKNTTFINASGLPGDNETSLSTAYDMYLIAQYGLNMEDGLFKEISTTPTYQMAATNKHSEPRNVSHTNEMLFTSKKAYYEYAKGIKTGTGSDIRNLVSMASKDGDEYLLVVMGAPIYDSYGNENAIYTYDDSKYLYNWAFDNFEFQTLAVPGEKTIVNNIKVTLAKDTDSVVLTTKDTVVELLPKDISTSSIMWDTSTLPETIEAPINKGDVIGTVDLKLNDEVIQTVTVVAAEDVQRSTGLYILNMVKNVVTSWWFLLIIAICVVLLILYIVMVVMYNQKGKKRRKKKYKRRR